MTKGWTLTLTAVALLAALSACGRKGDLEPPPGLSAAEIAAQEKSKSMDCVAGPEELEQVKAPIDGDASGAEAGYPSIIPNNGQPPC
tara:strand:+ start:1354 stop:1614 length:261 start_codon:yes stop_codon:yes gene_type:complete